MHRQPVDPLEVLTKGHREGADGIVRQHHLPDLLGVADANPRCLDEPAPQIIFQSFEDSAVRLQLSLWTATENYLDLRNSIALDVKAAFDAADIEPPFPQRSLVARGPLEVRVVDGD